MPRKKTHRETADVVEGICRMIRSVGRRVATEDTDGLQQVKALEDAVASALAEAVAGLRHNFSDREIGEVLGVTRQAVEQRWPRQRTPEGVA